MMYINVSRRNDLLAVVEARRPALEASGHEVADRLVGSLLHRYHATGINTWASIGEGRRGRVPHLSAWGDSIGNVPPIFQPA